LVRNKTQIKTGEKSPMEYNMYNSIFTLLLPLLFACDACGDKADDTATFKIEEVSE
jgi:hypothetical protein